MIPLHLSSLVAPAIGKSNQMLESHHKILSSKALDPKNKVPRTEFGKKCGKKTSPNAVDQQLLVLLEMIHKKCIDPGPSFDTNIYFWFKMIGLPK